MLYTVVYVGNVHPPHFYWEDITHPNLVSIVYLGSMRTFFPPPINVTTTVVHVRLQRRRIGYTERHNLLAISRKGTVALALTCLTLNVLKF